MKKITVILTFLISVFVFSQQQTITYSVTPASFDENQNITITINGSSVNEATWGVAGNALYLWTWSFDSNDVNILDCPTNGSWTNSNEANRLTYNSGNDTYTMSFVPSSFYARTNMGRIGFLVKAKDGTGDKKITRCFSRSRFVSIYINITSCKLNNYYKFRRKFVGRSKQ
uniref:hypothetical protein n=1 Tax=Flavobacterium sp. TaxID=239 RepID=UPI004048533F